MIHARFRPWMAGAGFVVLAFVHNLVVLQQQPAAELVIKMKASVSSKAEAFFDTGSGFNEHERSINNVSPVPGGQELFFPILAKTIHSIRFDPLQTTGTVEITEASIQQPRTHVLLHRFDVSKITPENEIASIVTHDGSLEIETTKQSNDPQLILPAFAPLVIRHSAQQVFSTRFFRINALWLLSGCLLLLLYKLRNHWWSAASRWLLWIDRPFTACARRFTASSVLPVDRTALWFYALCFIVFAGMAVAGLHGSSISVYGSFLPYSSVRQKPLVGQPRAIRMDEWNYHTPTILNQVLRRDRFSVDSSSFGPDKASLFGNVPTRHWTEWFRPQFWFFHCMPPGAAYACFWQTKGFLILTGIFSLLLLLTRSSAAAALGALWYFFSAYTQWAYSWPTLFPEMLGLFGWVIFLSAYLTIGRNRLVLALATLICIIFAVNFALCLYPPQQFPLVMLGLVLTAWWFWTRRDLIFCKEEWRARSLAVAACCFSIALVIGLFYLGAQKGFSELASTIYPGQRSANGGALTVAQMLSHFMDFWKTERRYPLELSNICESTGYLWLAPATLLIPWPAGASRRIKMVNSFLWVAFLILGAWMLLPIPASTGRFLFLDKVPPQRCLPALGLINIAIVVTRVSAMRPSQTGNAFRFFRDAFVPFFGIVLLLLIVLDCMNSVYRHFFTSFEIASTAVYTAFLLFCLRMNWRGLLAMALLLPLAATTTMVNPVDRGLDVILKSSLFAAIERQPELRQGRWLAFSSQSHLAGFVTATGLDLVNGLRIIPAFDELNLFDPEKKYSSIINRSCYLEVKVQPEGEPSEFESPQGGIVEWKVSPLDPRLKQIGVKYLVFDSQPDPSIRRKLNPLLEEATHSLWVYELL